MSEVRSKTHMIDQWKLFSVVLSKALDTLGYSFEMIKSRQSHFVKTGNSLINSMMFGGGLETIMVGSKAEGLTKWFENDMDIMCILSLLVCVDDLDGCRSINNSSKLLVDTSQSPPGYAQLSVLDLDNLVDTALADPTWLHAALFAGCFENSEGEVYLSSTLFLDAFTNQNVHNSKGPAVNITFLGLPFDFDIVPCIPYKNSRLLKQWIGRHRRFHWPGRDLLKAISILDGHLVPVGSKTNEHDFCEWRICFTNAERTLIRSLNDTQMKLLLLLKTLAKRILTPLCSAITSYVVKNILLWLAECLPGDMFHVEYISVLLMMSLRGLRRSVKKIHFRNYMIPARNLFLGKITPEEQTKVLQMLDAFIKTGPGFLLELDELPYLARVTRTVFLNPDWARFEQTEREVAEKFLLSGELSDLPACVKHADMISYCYGIEKSNSQVTILTNLLSPL